MENTNYQSNFSYIFIPFCLDSPADYCEFNDDVAKSGGWVRVMDRGSYLHKYVYDRLISETCEINIFHYTINPEYAKSRSLPLGDYCYSLSPKKYRDKMGETFEFRLMDVELFSFNTSICMLAYKIGFENTDPYYIAAAQYYLRKISAEHVYIKGSADASFIDISKCILGNCATNYNADFFFYATRATERANFLTYIDLPFKTDFTNELFYLKWCYNDRFEYSEESAENDSINYTADKYKIWGISPSAAVCIVNRVDKNKAFVESKFQSNFQSSYLFTYVFLLHQKYMLYMFLTKISVDIDDNLERLENYKRMLYEFNTKYVYTQISEVPQYQRFYEKVMHIFRINDMFTDVQEPLARISEIEHVAADERRQKYDNKLNSALIMLSLLTIVSALCDATAITANFSWILPDAVAKIIQVVLGAAVIGISIYLIIRLILIKNKK